jgi:hypothetical protein
MFNMPFAKHKKCQWQVICYLYNVWTAVLNQYHAKRRPHANVCEIKRLQDNVQPHVVQQVTDEQSAELYMHIEICI